MARPKKKKKDSQTKLVQTLVTPRTLQRVTDASEAEGISVSAFFRRLILAWEQDKFGDEEVQATGT
jgi:hypothetical protein